MCRYKLLLTIWVFLFSIITNAQILWPNGKKAAVVLTYDDGISSDWNVVMPQLEKRGFRGTFFLYGIIIKPQEIPIWRNAAKRGHELANHSIYHICGQDSINCKSSFDCLYCYNISMMIDEITMMNTFLSSLDGKAEHAYGYPCGEYKIGGVDYSDSLYQAKVSKYARDGSGGVFYKLKTFNPMHVPCYGGHSGMIADQYISKIKEAIQKHGLIVLVFHGVGGNYLKIEANEHAKILDFIKAHQEDLWVNTFSNTLDYISKLKK